MSGDIFSCYNWEWCGGLQLASCRQRPGMQQNILQCTGPAPHNKELSDLKCEEFVTPLPDPGIPDFYIYIEGSAVPAPNLDIESVILQTEIQSTK